MEALQAATAGSTPRNVAAGRATGPPAHPAQRLGKEGGARGSFADCAAYAKQRGCAFDVGVPRNRLNVLDFLAAELQAGRAGYRALLRHFINVSIAALKEDFGALGVHFDLWKGESDVNDLIPELVRDFKDRGVAEESDGAWIVRVAREDDKKELAPLILVTSEGSSLYGTTDLATGATTRCARCTRCSARSRRLASRRRASCSAASARARCPSTCATRADRTKARGTRMARR